MRPWPSSLRHRLTLWYGALLALPLVVFAIVCYIIFARALLNRTDRFVGDALAAFARELVAERRQATTLDQAMQTTLAEVRFPDLRIAILDSSHHVVATSSANRDSSAEDRRPATLVAQEIVAALRALDVTQSTAATLGADRGAYRLVSLPVVLHDQRFALTGTYPLSDIEEVLDRIRKLFSIAIPLFVLFAAAGGYFLAVRSLAPVAAMAARATDISATNLHERLPVAGGDEVVRLARVVNDLLDRLQGSFEQQRRFMADASHELRTPAAILRTEADVTLSREHRSEAEYRESVAIMQDAARRLTRIVDDLFLLARADSGHLVPRTEQLYLEELVHDAARGVRQVADQRSVSVAIGPVIEAPFVGDADLLGRLLLNLLDNAIKHSPEGGAVTVEMGRQNGHYEIAVIDAGPGIPAESRERIFERFYRVDVGRSRAEASATSGAGLGLAIARRIAGLHGGRLDLAEARPGRTEFRLSLPASQ